MAEALYRKYRPQIFEDVVGQEPVVRTLKNALRQDKVSHAYLFCGPRGTGKTTMARLLAKALLCGQGPTPDPDGTCENCELIAEGAHPDVYELDAASRTGVENVREEIISRVQFAPTRGRYKVYIIDEVHMLSTAAFNALLKTLEEPPSHVVFVLCTTDPQKVPETIHSRCQRFDFRRISPEAMVARLGAICIAEDVEFEGEALDLVAQRAEGGLRNALTSLEQIIAFENGKVSLAGAERLLGAIDSTDLAEIVAYVGKRDIANCFRWTARYMETGADLAQFVRDLAEHVRNLYVMALVGDDAELEVSETTRRELASELQWFGADRASRLLGVLGDLSAELKTSSNPRLAFEIALTRMVRPDSDITLEALAERIEALESGYSAVAHVVSEVATTVENDDGGVPGFSAQAASEGLYSEAPQPSLHPVSSPDAAQYERPATETAVPQMESEVEERGSRSESRASADPLSNPAALQRVWQAALAEVKKAKQAHAVLFMNTKARFDADAGCVAIVFPAESAFAFNAVQKPDVQDALAGALRKAAGMEVPFVFERAGSAARSTSASPARQETAVAASPVSAPSEALEPQPEPISTRTPESAPEPASEPVQPAAAPEPAPEAALAPEPTPEPAFPEEEVPYEYVPYEEFAFDQAPSQTPSNAADVSPDAAPPASGAPGFDAQSQTSHVNYDTEDVAGAAEIEAMLQAGFGDGVVLSEVDE